MPRSTADEVIFYEGSKRIMPRRITLWIEPTVTIASTARLHLDYAWPKECLRMQSAKWAFDLTAFRPTDANNEYIAGEAKAKTAEVDGWLRLFEGYIAGEHDSDRQPRKNAHKKWMRLARCRAPLVWAVGPDGESGVFEVSYANGLPPALNTVGDSGWYSHSSAEAMTRG